MATSNTVKEAGGAIGLMTNPAALRRWIVAGPEIAFEALEARNQPRDYHHHEQHPGVKAAFQKDVKSVVAVIGKPFSEEE